MKRPIAHVALLLAAMLAASQAAARVVSLDLDAGPPSESSIAALRSAFYLRSAALDQAEPSATAEQRQLRIQRHFDLVLAGLVANADRSLDMALARLELDRGQNWTAADRDAWRQKLAERRYANIRRLRAYQLRGLFPQNEHVADRAVPVFVDNYDTACAIGHLMRESGWGEAVDAIQHANNLVYVIDVHHGVLVDWVLISGLTQEEAALIQPAYDPATFDRTVDQLVNGGSITKDGLTYSNFELSGIDLFDDFELNRVDLSRVGVAVWKGVLPSNAGEGLSASFGYGLFLGAYNNVSILDSDTGESWRVTYSFTVTPVDAQARIAAASLESPRLWTQNAVLPAGGVITLSATPRGGSTSLGSLQLRSQLGPLDGATTAMFAPQQSITINGTARLFGAARFENVVHSFRVIPEPTAGGLASFGCALAFLGRTRRQPCEKLGQCRLSMPETRRTR